MTIHSTRILPLFLLISSLMSLGAAYLAQYGFGLKPCILCLYQRVPYGVVIVSSLCLCIRMESAVLKNILYGIVLLSLLVGAGIAFYHMGVEYKWFAGPDTCSGQGGAVPKTLEEMRAQLIGTKAVRCDQPQFLFLSLSMAAWNMLWSLFLAAITCMGIMKGRKNG